MPQLSDRQATLTRLRRVLQRFERVEPVAQSSFASLGPLELLVAAGWRPGGVIELVGHEPAGLTLLAWLAARAKKARVVLIDPTALAYPPALAALGLDIDRLLVVRPTDSRLALWAAEQSLRCPGVATTLCRLGPKASTTALRRLKLAAEAGEGLGLFFRPAAREPPFADVRLTVRPVASAGQETLLPRLEVEAVYVRGGTEGTRCVVELSADARLVPVLPTVARPAGSHRRIGG